MLFWNANEAHWGGADSHSCKSWMLSTFTIMLGLLLVMEFLKTKMQHTIVQSLNEITT